MEAQGPLRKCTLAAKTIDSVLNSARAEAKDCETEILNRNETKNLLEAIDQPVLLIQAEPRQVISANTHALKLFGKTLAQVENHRGGEVFDCIHSFTDAGCGKDVNCEGCKIKQVIVDTFETGSSQPAAEAVLTVSKNSVLESRSLRISTEPLGKLAVVKIERYEQLKNIKSPGE